MIVGQADWIFTIGSSFVPLDELATKWVISPTVYSWEHFSEWQSDKLIALSAHTSSSIVPQAGPPFFKWTSLGAPSGSRNLSIPLKHQQPSKQHRPLWLDFFQCIERPNTLNKNIFKYRERSLSPIEKIFYFSYCSPCRWAAVVDLRACNLRRNSIILGY